MMNVMDYHINIFYSEEDSGYIADIPDLKGCSAFGPTPEEALQELQEAKRAWLDAARAEGLLIPEPRYREKSPIRSTFLGVRPPNNLETILTIVRHAV